MKKSIENIKNIAIKRIIFFLFYFFFLNILVSLISPFVGLGSNEKYFLFVYFEISRSSHLIISLKLLISLFIFTFSLNYFLKNYLEIYNFIRGLIKDFRNFIYRNSPQIYILNLINLFLIIIIISFTSFTAECDGTMHYQFAKCFSFSDDPCIVSYRPFLYPLYISLSGCFLFNSMIPLVILNIFLSILMINYMFITFKDIGKNKSLIISVIFILCGFHLLYVFGLAEMHLVLFFLIISMCSLVNFSKKFEKKFFYLSLICFFMCFYTRLDTIVILIFGLLALSVILIKSKKIVFKEKINFTIYGSILSFIFILGWITYKSSMIYFNGGPADRYNKDSFVNSFFSFSLNHFEGFQLFWRMNHYDLNILNITGENIKNVNSINLGEISENFKEALYKSIKNEDVKKYLLSLKPLINEETWKLHYGTIDSNPENIIDQLFDPEFTIDPLVYPTHIPEILKISNGIIETNKILKKIYFGFKNKYPILKKSIFYDFLQAYGFKDPIYHSPYFYIVNNKGFNVGGCAKQNFSPKVFQFYKDLHHKRVQGTNFFFNYSQFIFTYSRHFLGILSLIFLVIGIFYKDVVIIYLINLSYLTSNYLIANFIETNGKTASYLIPLIFLNIFFVFRKKTSFF